MLDLLKKTYLVGLGLANITREKVEEIVDELVRRGEIAEKDRPHVLEDLLSRAKEEQKRLSASIRDVVRNVVGDLGIPSRDEFDTLAKRVEALEKSAQEPNSGPEDDSSAKDS